MTSRVQITITLAAALAGMAVAANTSGVFDLQGKQVDPLHGFPGKATVLVFVRADCPISNRYAPVIQTLAKAYSSRAPFWLVYPGRSQTAADILKQTSDYGYHLRVARDTRNELVKLSQAQTTPEAAVFNAAGKLVYHGRIDNWYEDFGRARLAPTTHELRDAIEATLDGRAPKVATAPAVGCSLADLE